ncbi:hypothetical protein [Cytobacillus pseudoceanisediminis]|uniref:hypothetical protein n=1 Tax=Cytobacillus pseudoceanisediminis TaxID=3051614 RepID=UPI003CFAEF7C
MGYSVSFLRQYLSHLRLTLAFLRFRDLIASFFALIALSCFFFAPIFMSFASDPCIFALSGPDCVFFALIALFCFFIAPIFMSFASDPCIFALSGPDCV